MIDIDLLLAYGAIYKKALPGEVLFMEGGRCNYYYQLISGKVHWLSVTEEGKEYLHSVVEPGQSFGELPLFDDMPYAATAIVQEGSLLLKLHKDNFHQLIAEHNEISLAFFKLMAERLRFKFFLLRELFSSEPEHRVASLLSYLKENQNNFCPDCGRYKLTRQEIANMTCLRVETVIRAMRQMHNRGEIEIVKGKAYIPNMRPVITANLER